MTKRPLIISDCDEVLLHMVAPFQSWLASDHGIAFDMAGGDFSRALRYIESDKHVEAEEIWRLLNLFFDTQMHRQHPINGARAAIDRLSHHADVVVLTNLKDFRRDARQEQLRRYGINVRVFTNQGPKGPALRAILDEYQPPAAIFVDDLAQHHDSVASTAPMVRRLHMCGEPLLAPHIPCAFKAGHANARIDDWDKAVPWLLDQLNP